MPCASRLPKRALPIRHVYRGESVRAAALLLILLGGCYLPVEKVALRIELPEELANQAKQLEVLPHIAELRREVERGVVAVELKRDAGKVRLNVPGACPASIDLRNLPAHSATRVALRRLFEVGPSELVVGKLPSGP